MVLGTAHEIACGGQFWGPPVLAFDFNLHPRPQRGEGNDKENVVCVGCFLVRRRKTGRNTTFFRESRQFVLHLDAFNVYNNTMYSYIYILPYVASASIVVRGLHLGKVPQDLASYLREMASPDPGRYRDYVSFLEEDIESRARRCCWNAVRQCWHRRRRGTAHP